MAKASRTQKTREHALPLWTLDYIGDPREGAITHTIRSGIDGPIERQWTHQTQLALVAPEAAADTTLAVRA
jgi:hypothetical protein